MNVEQRHGLLARLNPGRMRELALSFSGIGSSSTSTLIAAEWYAGCLRASGAADVQIVRDAPHLPAVVAGFPGVRRRPILQFVGQLHSGPYPPARVVGGQLVGRGLVHGTAELIAVTEVARALAQDGLLPGGGLLLVAQSAPAGDPGTLSKLIAHGVVGDAVVLGGGEHAVAPIRGLGMATFQVRFSDPERQHAAAQGGQARAALEAAHTFSLLLRRRARSAARRDASSDESIVVRRIDGGEQDTLSACVCRVEGSWQWLAGRSIRDVSLDLEELAGYAGRRFGVCVELSLTPQQEPCSLSPYSAIVQSLRAAHLRAVGYSLPFGTAERPDSAALFLRAGVPALGYGARAEIQEDGQEVVDVAELDRLARVYLHLALTYLYEECVPGGDADEIPPWARAAAHDRLSSPAEQRSAAHENGAPQAEEPDARAIFATNRHGSRA
jgi:acetylornithine deacetylase/succinyl-diaminopimelate desuccinylase-like protein